MSNAPDPSLEATLDSLAIETSGETLSVRDLVAAFRRRGFGPVILILALICMLPTGAIPGVASGSALLILSLALQIVFGRRFPWIPGPVADLSLKRDTVLRALEVARPTARRIDRTLATRLTIFTHPVANSVVGICIGVLALSIIPLQAIPFAAALPALIIAVFALGITARDGALTLLGLAATSAVAVAGWWLNVW